MKKIYMLLLAMMMALSITACGSSDGGTGETDTAAQQSGEETVAATKTLAYFNEYVSGGSYTMEMKTEYEGIETTNKSASKDDMLYTESDMNGTQSIMIMRDGYQYILDPSSKTCVKMSLDMASTTEMFADEAANYETAVTTGTEEINGASYDYEEFEVEGASVKYYFDGKALKYISTVMEGETYLMEIVSMEKGADASLFDIPADYTVVEY